MPYFFGAFSLPNLSASLFLFFLMVLPPALHICVFVRLIFSDCFGYCLYAAPSLNYFAKLYVNSMVALTWGFGSDATHSSACSSYAFQCVVFFSSFFSLDGLLLVRLYYTALVFWRAISLFSYFSVRQSAVARKNK